MNETELVKTLKKGEGISIEFKACKGALSRDVFETVCAFLNRAGGELFIGVDAGGKMTGVDSQAVEQIKKDFERTLEWDFGNRKESWQRTLEEFTLETPTDATRVTTQFVIRTQFGVTTATGSASCFSRREFYTSIFLNVASTWRTDRYRLSTIQEATPSIHPLCVGE